MKGRNMKKHGIPINDLHAHALRKLPGIMKAPGDVHYTPEGYAYLAEKVAEEILLHLADEKENFIEGKE